MKERNVGESAPQAPRLLAPADGAGTVSVRPIMAMALPEGACDSPATSRWQIATDDGFKTVVYDRLAHDVHTHVALANLPGGGRFVWRACWSADGTTWSRWSEPSTYTTEDGPEARVHAFQDGFRGYAGTRDVDIRGSGADPSEAVRDWNQGRQDVLRTGRRRPGLPTDETYRSLIRFELQALSDPDAVTGAYLVLTGWEHDRRDPSIGRVALNEVFRVRRPWGEGSGLVSRGPEDGEASWLYACYPDRWRIPGAGCQSDADDADCDTDATPLGMMPWVGYVGLRMTFSSERFVSLVREWIGAPETNFGILIRAADPDARQTLNVASREHPVVSHRPKLVVESVNTRTWRVRRLTSPRPETFDV